MNAKTASARMPGKARGFTMIELMITIAIAIILANLALPSFRSMIASERISSESFDIIAMLTLTRSEAIKRNAKVTSTPANYDWKKGWTITWLVNGNTTPLNRKEGLLGDDITIKCYQGTTLQTCNPITYDGSGRLDLTPGSVAQSIQILTTSLPAGGGQNARCITISLSGMPRSKKGNC